MPNTPTSTVDDQIDSILLSLRSSIEPDEDGHSYYDTPEEQEEAGNDAEKQAKAALKALLVRERIDLLRHCYVDQGEIYVKFNGGFAEQYEYIKRLKATTTQEGE